MIRLCKSIPLCHDQRPLLLLWQKLKWQNKFPFARWIAKVLIPKGFLKDGAFKVHIKIWQTFPITDSRKKIANDTFLPYLVLPG